MELKLEAARLVNEEHMSIREVATRLDIQNKSQVQVWAAKAKQGMSLEPATSKRGRLRTTFSSMDEEMAYLRAEIEYLKKQYTQGVTSKAARFQIIEDLRARHGLVWLLKLAAVSRSGYYKWRKSRSAAKERRYKEHELESHLFAIHRVHPYFGYL